MRETVQRQIAAARTVRRDKYAWPGGYALALVTADGAILCPECVTAEYSQICHAARTGDRLGGWAPEGIATEEWAERDECCVHCGRVVFNVTGGK